VVERYAQALQSSSTYPNLFKDIGPMKFCRLISTDIPEQELHMQPSKTLNAHAPRRLKHDGGDLSAGRDLSVADYEL